MRISDWSSDVCSSDLDPGLFGSVGGQGYGNAVVGFIDVLNQVIAIDTQAPGIDMDAALIQTQVLLVRLVGHVEHHVIRRRLRIVGRSEEHPSELQSLMRTSHAVLCLKKKNNTIST